MNYTNDDFMVYDINLHQYILTPNAIDNDIVPFNDISPEMRVELERLIPMVSTDFYSEVLSYGVTRDRYYHYLSLPDKRPYIYKAMIMMLEDITINRSTPGLAFSNERQKLVTPRVRKYLEVNMLATNRLIHISSYNSQVKGVDW